MNSAERGEVKGACPKVCFVMPKALAYIRPEWGVTPGGAERQIVLLSKWLVKHQNWEVSVLVGDFGQEDSIESDGVKFIKTCQTQGSKLKGLWVLLRSIWNQRADVIVFRSADLGVAVSGILSKLSGQKVVYMMAHDHEMEHRRLVSILGSTCAVGMSLLYRSVDALSSQSRDQAEGMKRYRGLEVAKVVPNIFVKTPEVQSSKDAAEEQRDTVLWVGRCDPFKRCELFLDLVEAHPEAHFTMVCSKTTQALYVDAIFKRAKALEHLDFIEGLAPHELPYYYRRAKFVVMTSVAEGYSNVMLEAFDAGVPMLATNVNPDGILDRFGMGRSFGDDQWSELLACFKAWYSDVRLQREMGDKAKDFVKRCHQPEVTGKAFVELIQGVLKN